MHSRLICTAFFTTAFCSLVFLAEQAKGQTTFTGTGQVGPGSPISGTVTDADGDSIGYTISTVGPLFFNWNGGSNSELGGVVENFGSTDGTFSWTYELSFDQPLDSITLVQTPVLTAGANSGGSLQLTSDASSASVVEGTQGLGNDSLSNLNGSVVTGGNVSTTLVNTFNTEDDWSITLQDVQTVTVDYDPTATAPTVVGNEWLTFVNAQISAVAVPEPSAGILLGLCLAHLGIARRR